MIHIQGDGGHAKVVREILKLDRLSIARVGSIVAVGDNEHRRKEVERIGGPFTWAFHPSAIIPDGTAVGNGTVICAGAVIQPDVRIGKHVIINTGATVDHDCVIEDYAHIAPGVHLCGGVHVGEGALVGVGSCAVPGAKIPAWSLVKAGSVCK